MKLKKTFFLQSLKDLWKKSINITEVHNEGIINGVIKHFKNEKNKHGEDIFFLNSFIHSVKSQSKIRRELLREIYKLILKYIQKIKWVVIMPIKNNHLSSKN